MTAVNQILEKALARQRLNAKRAERRSRLKKALRYISSVLISFTLPAFLAFLGAAILPLIFPAFNKGSLLFNFIYCFCKVFFICTPFQVFFIVKRTKPEEFKESE